MRILLTTTLLTLLALPAFAQNFTCDSYPNVPVRVTAIFDEPRYDYSRSIDSITELSPNPDHRIHETIPLGLTFYQPVLEVNNAVRVIKRSDGLTCATIDHVDVKVGYKDVIVYIAHEISPNSCGFNEVMAHEQRHIDVNRAILQRYIPRIEQELQEFVRLNGVSREPNYEYTMSLLRERMKQIANNLAQQMVDDNLQEQATVDSYEEYKRVSLSCNGELQQVIRPYNHNRP